MVVPEGCHGFPSLISISESRAIEGSSVSNAAVSFL